MTMRMKCQALRGGRKTIKGPPIKRLRSSGRTTPAQIKGSGVFYGHSWGNIKDSYEIIEDCAPLDLRDPPSRLDPCPAHPRTQHDVVVRFRLSWVAWLPDEEGTSVNK